MASPRRLLFVCSQNRLRSPTAEQLFSQRPGIEALSAGTNNDAETPLDREMIDWADIIFVMEPAHRSRLQSRFRAAINGKRIVCLHIPDDYDYMDPDLVQRLHAAVDPYLA